MRVRRIEILRSAGISPGFTIDGFAQGLTIVEGRNESGKSTLANAIRALLWPARHAHLRARGMFEAGGQEFHAFVDVHGGGWEGNTPTLPDESAGRGIIVGISDLWRDGEQDMAIREAMRRELQGGYDLQSLHEAAAPRSPTGPMRAMREAEANLHAARQAARDLMAQEASLPELQERAGQCRTLAARVPMVEKALERLACLDTLAGLRAELASLPQGALRIAGDEAQRLHELRNDIDHARASIDSAGQDAERLRADMAALGLADKGVPVGAMDLLAKLESEATAIRQQLADAAREAHRASARAGMFAIEPRAIDDGTLIQLDKALASVQEARERMLRDKLAAERPQADAARRWSNLVLIAASIMALLALVVAGFAQAWWALGCSALTLVLVIMALWMPRLFRDGGAALLLERAEQSEQAYGQSLAELRSIAGVDDELASTLSLVTAARRAKQHDEALEDMLAARANVESLEAQLAGVLARAESVLSAYMSESCGSVDDLSKLRSNLAHRVAEYGRLADRIEAAHARESQASQHLKRTMEQRRVLLERLGLTEDTEDQVHEWLRLRSHAVGLRDGIVRHEAVLAVLEAALAAMPELLDINHASLLTHKAECQQASRQASELEQRIGNLQGQLDRARHGADVSGALHAYERAAQELSKARDFACTRVARQMVLDQAVAGVEHEDMPALVRAADALLAKFTGLAYGLRIDSSQTPVVRDLRSGVDKNYEQLSTGTRAQALLAMRLAGALEAERRAGTAPLPIILDEPLATTDDERFEAIAGAMLGMVQEGRQLVYLTCEPAHADRLAKLAADQNIDIFRIDLDAVRNRQKTARNPSASLLEPKTLPSPEGLPREEYLHLLGVTELEPWGSLDAIDLYHVLSDDLATLHTLALHGLRTVGQVLAQQGRLGERFSWPLVADAGRLAQRVVSAWRVGRCRPLRSEDLIASGAFGATFLDGILALNAEMGGSAEKLLELLESRSDERVKGFQGRKIEQFREHLRSQGLLPEGTTLDRGQILERAVNSDVIGCLDLGKSLGIAHALLSKLETPEGRIPEALASEGA